MDTYDTKLPRSRSAEHMRPAPSIASMRPDAMVQLQWNINKSRVRPSYKESKTMSEKKRNEEKSKSVRPFTIYPALDYLQHDAQSWILVFFHLFESKNLLAVEVLAPPVRLRTIAPSGFMKHAFES